MGSVEKLVALASSDYPDYVSDCDCDDCTYAKERVVEIEEARATLQKISPHLYNANFPPEDIHSQKDIDNVIKYLGYVAQKPVKKIASCGIFNHAELLDYNNIRFSIDPEYFVRRASEDFFRIYLFVMEDGKTIFWRGYSHEGEEKHLAFEDAIIYLKRDASDMLIDIANLFYD